MSSRIRNAAIIVVATLLPGCASIVSDNDTTTYFETEPEKARCELHGQDFKRVVNTPTSIGLPADAAPVTVACQADGYRKTTAVLDTSMDGWIIGNVIFGGLIGVVIDAARGAGQKFPPKFAVVLEPAAFSTTEKRDEWYAHRREKLASQWEKVIAGIESSCEPDFCASEIEQAELKRDKELRELDERRLSSTIRGA